MLIKQGLASILSNATLADKSQGERDTLILSSRLFYYNRYTVKSHGDSALPTDPVDSIRGLNITVDQVRKYAPSAPPTVPSHDGSSAPTAAPETAVDADGEERVLSFAELKELIEQGKTDQIPHNKKIPDVVNVSPRSACA